MLRVSAFHSSMKEGRMTRVWLVILWVCQIALALMFLGAGVRKFTSPMWSRMFAHWGYPDHFYLVIGAIEVAGALGLLLPRTTALAAVGLIVIMIGAAVTHALHGEWQRLPQIAVMSALLVAVTYGRWSDARLRNRSA
jgi:putative oxidoreductase